MDKVAQGSHEIRHTQSLTCKWLRTQQRLQRRRHRTSLPCRRYSNGADPSTFVGGQQSALHALPSGPRAGAPAHTDTQEQQSRQHDNRRA